jgi:tRNA-Thr(GGU) m(6)t(6)A37 methyltransferase TsaA
VHPIGFVRSPFVEKAEAPRQAVAEGAVGVEGRIEILPEHRHALDDLEGFDRIWVIFWFHRSTPEGGRDSKAPSKVLPPRSDRKRGVFATRSPHRPNPIGMSAVRLERVDDLVVHVRDLDLLDGTPVLDIKPYIRYADAFPEARAGWLDKPEDPRRGWTVRFAELAATQLSWLKDAGLTLDLRSRIAEALALGPEPNAYRRIKKTESGELVLAVKEWRVRFAVDAAATSITALSVASGFRERELAKEDPALALHRAFAAHFG